MEKIRIKSSKRCELIDITDQVQRAIAQTKTQDGICYVFVPHTTAGVTINEDADPSVREDMLYQLDKMVPHSDNYAHMEGNSAAHIKASLVGSSVTVFLQAARLALGTWQGIYFAEFDGPRTREVWWEVSPKK